MTRFARSISGLAVLSLGLSLIWMFAPAAHAQQPGERTRADAARDSAEQMRAFENYRLTLDDMRKYIQVGHNMDRVAREHPELEPDTHMDTQHLDRTEAKINGNPLLLKAVTDAGLTTRQYMMMSTVVFLTSMASLDADSANAIKFLKDAHMNPANLAFLKDHKRELAAMQRPTQQAAPAQRQRVSKVSVAMRDEPLRNGRQQPSLPSLSPEAQLAYDELSPRFGAEIQQIQGWFRDRPVLYFNFGFVTEPVTAGRVLWPVHGFDARGNPVAIRGQRPIFSTIPGLGEYSGIWRLSYVITADHVQPNQLRDAASVDALVRRKRAALHETNLTFNLPIVARGSHLANDSTSGMLGWYQGRDVQYFDFGPASTTPAPMWRFARGQEPSGEPKVLAEQNSIVDSIPVAPTYPDLWDIHVVQVDSAFVPNSLKSAAELQRTNPVIEPHDAVRNLPITVVDGARVARAVSPLRTFADMRSPFPPAPTRPQ